MDTNRTENTGNSIQNKETNETYGKYGRLREEYLMMHKPDIFLQLSDSGRLDEHLKKTDSEAGRLMDALISHMAAKKEVREKLKGMEGVEREATMDRLYRTAEEVVLEKLVYR